MIVGVASRWFLHQMAQEQIRRFLADRVNTTKKEAQAKGDPDWRSRLAEILTYRRWFQLRLEYRTPQSAASDGASGGWRSLERGDHGLLSQGAKIVTLLQPFLAVGAALDAVELPLYTTCGVPEVCLARELRRCTCGVPEVCLPCELQRFGRARGGP